MKRKQDRGNPWEKANVLSRTFFWWLLPLFKKGFKKDLDENDLYDCCMEQNSEFLGDILESKWQNELKTSTQPSFTKAAIRTFGPSYLATSILVIFKECVIKIMQAMMFGWLIQFYSDSSGQYLTQCFLCAAGICVSEFCYSLSHHLLHFGLKRVGMKLRIASSTLIYRKALKLSRGSMGQTTVGQMVNMLSNDVNRFDQASIFVPYLIVGPIQTIITMGILWNKIHVGCFAGVFLLLLCLPIQSAMSKCFSQLRLKTAILTDERVRLTNEVITAIRVIKMYAWEKPFSKLVAVARKNELMKIKLTALLRAVNIVLFLVLSKLTLFVSFVTYVLMGGQLTAERVFISITLFNNLRLPMYTFVPTAIALWVESQVSLQRLQMFLLLEEKNDDTSINRMGVIPEVEKSGVCLNNVTAKWNDKVEAATLSNISISVHSGDLLAIVGPIGAGKTSLLMTLLGELSASAGQVKLRGRVAYACQESWVFSGNIRDNIVFGGTMEEKKYNQILQVCALDKDISQFPYGDLTLVGEKGVSLSGGQKARVNLARALYRDADIYLLDDPLSAVDTTVAKHLFNKCIMGYLKDKVQILVTHQVQFLKDADNILVLKEGKCLVQGRYKELEAKGIDIMSLVDHEKDEICDSKEEDIVITSHPSASNRFKSTHSLASLTEKDACKAKLQDADAPKQAREVIARGSIKTRVYLEYFKSGTNPFFAFICISLIVLTQAVFSGSDYWLAMWTDAEDVKTKNDTTHWENSPLDTNTYIYVYTGMIGGLFVLSLLRNIVFFVICLNASVHLHSRMFRNITRATVNFFDNNPVGQILNRFTKDLGLIDELLPVTIFDTITYFLTPFAAMIIVVTVNPWIVIPSFIITIFFFYLRRILIKPGRDIKRLEGIARSPTFSHLATSLNGLTTIRAFEVQNLVENQFYQFQDLHTSSWFLYVASTHAFATVLDLLLGLFITIVTIVVLVNSEGTSGSQMGLAMSSALTMGGFLSWAVRQSADLENQMTSVERILEYNHLPQEDTMEKIPFKRPSRDWPQNGEVDFQNVSLSYALADPPVLKGLSCVFKAQEKVGIVGRTGAGKSSMIAALFRMFEPDGIIYIDGVATKDIGLYDLRSKISIIPQDPVLFTGPVRRNIDPIGKYSDCDLWIALQEVELKEVVEDLPGGLDSLVSEGGGNFSVGQRQLICLARAILQKNRILVLDEATANVDHRTDFLIQQAIREKFRYCTVLTIAHRLHTIMDSDRVLVLQAGRIVEFDEPQALLQCEDGHFTAMVAQTGNAMSQQLKDIAFRAYEQRRRNAASSSDAEANM